MASSAMCAMLVAASLFASASGECGGPKPLMIGQTFLANSLDPVDANTAWALTSHGIAERLFTVDSQGDVVPQLGKTITKIDSLTWDVKLEAGKKFSDGSAVTAADVVAALNKVNTDNSDNSQASAGTMTWTAQSSDTVRVVSERASPVMKSVLAEWPFVVFKSAASSPGGYVFTGPFIVDNFEAGVQLDLAPNTQYPSAADRGAITIKKYASGADLAVAQKIDGELDMSFHLPTDTLADVRDTVQAFDSPGSVKSFAGGYHYMMWHNANKAPLDDKDVRLAIDLAIDRSALTQTLLGGDPTRSLFPHSTPWELQADKRANSDVNAAKAALDSAGWVAASDGKRSKNGSPLTVKVVAYPQRPGLVAMLPVVAQQLEAVGFTVEQKTTSGANWDELEAITGVWGSNPENFGYDLLMWAQNPLPAPDPQWYLNKFFRSTGGSNYGCLNSSAIDALLDTMVATEGHTARVAACEAAHVAILDEVPVSNLMTPHWHVGLSSRLGSYVPYGADYYIVRGATKAEGVVPTMTCTTGTTTVTTTTVAPSEVSKAPGSRGCWAVAGAAAALLIWA